MSNKDVLALLLDSNLHILENIKFADQKAIALITINSGILGFAFLALTPLNIYPNFAVLLWLWSQTLLVLAIGSAVIVIRPRGNRSRKRGKGILDPDRIYQYKLHDFIYEWRHVDDRRIIVEICTHLHDRSLINFAKYEWLERCLYLSFAGWVLGLIVIATPKIIHVS